jgi:hypothetical protein
MQTLEHWRKSAQLAFVVSGLTIHPNTSITRSPDASGSQLQPIEQQVNAREPPVSVWQFTSSKAAGGCVPIDWDGVFVCHTGGADRDHNPQRNAYTVRTTNLIVIAFWVIADTRVDLPHEAGCQRLLNLGIRKLS